MKSATKVLFSSKRKTVMQLLFHVEFFLFQSMSAFISIQYNTIQYNKEDNLYKTIYNKSILHVHHNIISHFVLKYNGPHSLRKWLIVTKRLPCMREVRV